MAQKFFCFLMLFTTIKLLAADSNHERPLIEEPAKKKFKSGSSINPLDFKEALHLLCAQGELPDIKAMLEITNINKINLVDGPSSKTAFAYFMDYYIDNQILLNNSVQPADLIEIIQEFIRKEAFLEPTYLLCLDIDIICKLEIFTRNLIKNSNKLENIQPLITTLVSLGEVLDTHGISMEFVQQDLQFQKIILTHIKNNYKLYKKNKSQSNDDNIILFNDLFGAFIKICNLKFIVINKLLPKYYSSESIFLDFCEFNIEYKQLDEELKEWADLLVNAIKEEMNKNVHYFTCQLIEKKPFILQFLALKLMKQNINIFTKILHGYQYSPKNFLHWAVQYNAENLVRLAINNGADVNAKSGFRDDTPLHEAVGLSKSVISETNHTIIKLLLDNKANPNILNDKKESPFMMVKNLELAKLLKEKGGQIDTKLPQPELFETCNRNNIELLEFWAELGVNFQQTNKNKQNLLINFCSTFKFNYIKDISKTENIPEQDLKYIKIIEFLLKQGIRINATDYSGRTALSCAIHRRLFYIVKSLLEHNAEVKQEHLELAYKSNNKMLPNLDIIKLLVNRGLTDNNQYVQMAIAQREDFFKALEDNDVTKIEQLLKQGAGIFVNAKKDGVLILDTLQVNDEIMDLLAPYITARMASESVRKTNIPS